MVLNERATRVLTELDEVALNASTRVNNYEIEPDEGLREIFKKLAVLPKTTVPERARATELFLDSLDPDFKKWFEEEVDGISRTRTIVNEELQKIKLLSKN